MDWSNEDYVRLYTRDTPDDLMLSWQAVALWRAMLSKFDRAGRIDTKRGRVGLAAMVRIPIDVVEPAIQELLSDGRVKESEIGYFAPNFYDAQTASKSDKKRQQESRERRREESAGIRQQSMVYVLRSPDRRLFKIGYTANRVSERKSQIESASGEFLELVASFPGSLRDEREIHSRFSEFRTAGEWFTESDEIVAWLVSLEEKADGVTASPAPSQPVTCGHDSSHLVTLTSADPLLDPKELSPARDPVVPSTEHKTPTVTVAEVSVTKMLWGELETARMEAGAELGVEVQQLPFGDDGERLLAERVVAARKRGAEDLDKLVGQTRHAIEMAKQETISREKPFEWFSGAVFSLNNFRRLVAKTTSDLARAGPRDHSTRRHEPKPRKSTDLTPPTRPTPGTS